MELSWERVLSWRKSVVQECLAWRGCAHLGLTVAASSMAIPMGEPIAGNTFSFVVWAGVVMGG